jgi:inorganic pyrophosphatase
MHMIRVLIQVEAGSHDKKLYNEKTLEYRETRRVSQPYPYPYGFIVGTSAEDGDAVDCYLITKDKLQAGMILECEPIGLLEQYEDDEIDHKVLAAMPGQDVEVGEELLKELQDFIYSVFAQFPDIHVRVGPIQPRQAALNHIHNFRDPARTSA